MNGEEKNWSVYLVRTREGTLYTGVATDVERRFEEHSTPGGRGAKYLRGRGPLELVYRCELGGRGLALQVEGLIKSRQRAEKESIVAEAPDRGELLQRLDLEQAQPEASEDRT